MIKIKRKFAFKPVQVNWTFNPSTGRTYSLWLSYYYNLDIDPFLLKKSLPIAKSINYIHKEDAEQHKELINSLIKLQLTQEKL